MLNDGLKASVWLRDEDSVVRFYIKPDVPSGVAIVDITSNC